jgi:hypothetical protein
VAALKGTVGQTDTIELFKAFGRARTCAELEKAVPKGRQDEADDFYCPTDDLARREATLNGDDL